MRLLVVLAACPLLVGFAPVPPLRPIDDADKAISRFDRHACAADRYSQDGLTSHKKQLLGQLEDLQDRLAARGRTDEAAAVRDRAVLAASLSPRHRLGKEKALALIREAAVRGKYQHLLHVIHAPDDHGTYSPFKDFGFWNGSAYATQANLKPGHWVYVHPRWFIWREGPKEAQVLAP